jgi:hypothetical protein
MDVAWEFECVELWEMEREVEEGASYLIYKAATVLRWCTLD